MEEVTFDSEDELARYYAEAFELNEHLLRCTSEARAASYIDTEWNTLSTADKERVVEAFYGFANRTLPRSVDRSGGGDGDDPRVCRLLELADTCHDFFDHDTSDEAVSGYIDSEGYVLPGGMTMDVLRNERKFIEFVSTKRTLKFGSDTVLNTLYGGNILKCFPLEDGQLTEVGLEALFASQQRSVRSTAGNRQSRMCSVDVWTVFSESKKGIKLVQIAQLCGIMRRWMGNDCAFQVDSSDDPLVVLVCATQHMSSAFFKKFRVSQPETSDMKVISDRLRAAVVATGDEVRTTWETFVTDANYFDATENKLRLPCDPRPTGKIYREDRGYQVELHGLVDDDKSNKRVSVTLTDTGKTPATLALSNRETTKNLSKNALALLARLDVNTTIKSPKNITQQLTAFSNAFKYALKRAGDWGQIEHCVRYKKVFVTSDKLAAMYAYYRKIRFVYLRREASKTETPEMWRYIFLLSRCSTPERARFSSW